ncbi:carboxyl transferase domain-containing protein [Streptomyces justiciae]|uniref:carboxyl transferase domain-containing protein n=1 Tax=Streptomyces justiciae TaxID=2780140 RepID=UPI002117B06D|nr:carboxyl transferase domain-containing protein [Streptomyces justiciae]MCW8379729.1 carbamoyl-phosphate synthase large subunit [Streptomyces justiciae]
MEFQTVLVANRGEIAIRIMRAAAELGSRTVAVHSDDDADSLHTRKADVSRALGATGAGAYLDVERILRVAKEVGADAVHPGYGFLSEHAGFARRCTEEGIVFVGPTADVLALFGDKAKARELAQRLDVPVLRGTPGGIGVDEAIAFMESIGGPVILKATAGGGGRGSRVVTDITELPELFERCRSEAASAFGDGTLFAEELLAHARHIEVQVIGDGTGSVSHLWERDCSLQRRRQKVVEMAPAPGLAEATRSALLSDAVRMAADVAYGSLGTFEFLVDVDTGRHVFMEANPRLQVEHTVTEEVLGVDLVRAQLQLAVGRGLADIGLDQKSVPDPHGIAVQSRVNMETMEPDGTARPAGGVLTAFEVPSGKGYRTDSFGYVGYRTSPHFDSLLAKVIAHTPSASLSDALTKADRALAELRVEGVATNSGFLRAILTHPDVRAGRATTRFVDDHMAALVATTGDQAVFHSPADASGPAGSTERVSRAAVDGPDGTTPVHCHMQGTVVAVAVTGGDAVRAGQQLLVVEAMKMEHVVTAPEPGVVRLVTVAVGDAVLTGQPLVFIETGGGTGARDIDGEDEVDLDVVPPDIAQVVERHALRLDAARPQAVAKRRATHQRTARENIDDLCDEDTFVEHGGLVLTPGTGRPLDEVIPRYAADGLVCGIGGVNSEQFGPEASRTVVCAYDYTVLAGTQGAVNHPKMERMLKLAGKWKLPLVFFTEGGGGRAGTGSKPTGKQGSAPPPSDYQPLPQIAQMFSTMARLNGVVPTVAINSGRCFAGNAALLGACDVVIATADSNIGMAGPALIEGGGLGHYSPDEIGPIEDQLRSGVVDIAVEDEAEAVAAAKHYLSFFQGPLATWEHADQRLLRRIVPENRLRTYEMRRVVETVADTGSVLELRRGFGRNMITALARVEGRSVGIIANDPNHLAGAIDSDGADKAARFMQLCDAYDIPLVVLCDTPGFMVGPDSERTGLVRHGNRLIVTGANLSVPLFMVVVRKACGLGGVAMGGGNTREPFFSVAWPTGDFAGMGIEGQIKLGHRDELMNIADPTERKARFDHLVAKAQEHSKALNTAVAFGIDDVIDPLHTRHWLGNGLRSVAGRSRADVPRRVDLW